MNGRESNTHCWINSTFEDERMQCFQWFLCAFWNRRMPDMVYKLCHCNSFHCLLNAFTLATFASNHQLRKHSTYLIINLTVADLIFGTAEGLLFILEPAILERCLPCSTEEWFSWQELMLLTLYFLFPVASLVYILLISLERLHATIYPFKHCLIGGKVYFRIIAFSWLLALALQPLCLLFFYCVFRLYS